jgi:heat-inducible transcriptional repressor
MADLEEMGFLQQPHTSAGRIPTEKGLRYYLDSIMQFKVLQNQERAQIRSALLETQGDARELLQRTSQILSRFCRQAGVVLWPRLEATLFKRIEFIRLNRRHLMVILVSKTGLVHNRVVDLEEDIRQEELDKYSRYVNELLHDLHLGEVKSRIVEEMKKEKVLFDKLYSRALGITQRAFQSTFDNADIYIEGQTNLLNNPEFADITRLRRLLEAFEDKTRIIRLLDRTLNKSKGTRIILGAESNLEELQEISVISSPYMRGNTLLGVLGVIGPLRMDYSRIIPVVEFTAGLLSQLLDEPEDN